MDAADDSRRGFDEVLLGPSEAAECHYGGGYLPQCIYS